MQVKHALASMRADIGQDTIAALGDSVLTGDAGSDLQAASEEGGIDLLGLGE